MAGLLLTGVNVYAAGDLTVMGKLGVGGGNTTQAQLLVQDSVSGPRISLANEIDRVNIFYYKAGQNNHLSTISGGYFDYYLFEDSTAGLNKEFRVYGNPAGASGTSYGSLQVVGTTSSFEIKTGSSASNLLLIPGSGKVGIGVSSPNYALDVAGAVNASGGYSQVSDMKFKKDVASIESPLNKILKINGVYYAYKTEEYKEKRFDDGRHYGVIAQEVERVIPEIVKEGVSGEKSVVYTEMIPLLIEAVKEQQKIIEKQNKEIEELKAGVKKALSSNLTAEQRWQ